MQPFRNRQGDFRAQCLSSHHDHLVCLDCGRVEEFYDEEIESRQHKVAVERGFKIAEHALAIYGNCVKQDCPHKTSN
ncbi:transcriptional repressor [Massilia sp. B-10]|nr:transcriptional repressor [Massilia sp. B-10]